MKMMKNEYGVTIGLGVAVYQDGMADSETLITIKKIFNF